MTKIENRMSVLRVIFNMKNIADKFVSGVKKAGQAAGDFTKKYAAKALITGAVLLGGTYGVGAQDFDYSTLSGMDMFSRPNNVSTRAYGDGDVNSDGNVNFADAQAIYMGTKNDYADVNGDGEVTAKDGEMIEDFTNGNISYLPGDWNALNKLEGVNSEGISRRRAEKIDWLNKMKAIDKTDQENYINGVFDCGWFSLLTSINTTGASNLQDWKYYDIFQDVTKDKEVTNGRFNLPIYRVATVAGGSANPDGTKIEAGGHWINGAHVGHVDPNVKDDPTDFKQLYCWEPQTDKEVQPGDFSMNKDSYANIYWFGRASADGNDWIHFDDKVLSFDLNNGEAVLDPGFSEDGIKNYLLRENSDRVKANFKEMANQIIDAHSGQTATTPEVTSNLTHYTPTIEVVEGEKEYTISPDYPEYFEQVNKYLLNTKMGRWSASNLSNLGDTLEVKTTYADIVSPTIVAPADIEAGYNANMGLERMGSPTVNDDSPYPVETWHEDNVLSEDANYKVIERTHSGEDVSGNIGSAKQTITLDLNVGIEELNTTKSFDLDQNYPNPVSGMTTIPYASMGGDLDFKLIDMNGVVRKVFEKDNTFMGEGTFQLNMNGMAPGQYILMGNDEKGSVDCITISKK